MLAAADERDLRFPAQLRLEAGELLDIGRVGDHEVPALAGSGGAVALPQLDLEPEPLGVLARKRQRVGRDVHSGHPGVGALVLERERDRARADSDVEDPGPLDSLHESERAVDERLGLGPRHERARVRLQRQPPEAPLAEDVRQWLASLAAHEERLEPVHALVQAAREPRARRPEQMRDEPLCVDPRRLDTGRGEPPLRLGERLANGHSPRRAPALVGRQRLGELVEATLQDPVELMDGQLDPVVGEPVLGEVVRADLLGPLAGADLRVAGGAELGAPPLELALVEARAQHAHRLLPVLELRLLVLHRDDDAGRQVGDADCRVGRVDGLPAGAGRAVDVDLEVVRVDLDLDLLRLRHHGDGRGRGVDAAGALRLGDALHAVRAALPLEDRVGAVALDGEDDLLEAAAVRRARLELLDLEAAPLGVAREHPVDVTCPERGLVAADALAHLDDHVLAIGRVGRDERQPQLFLKRGRALLELGDELPQVGVAVRRVEVVPRGLPLLRELVRPLELLQAPTDVRRLTVVVVDGRVGQPRLQLLVVALEVRDEVVEVRRHGDGQPNCVLQRDLRDARERLRDGAVLLRGLRCCAEAVLVEAGDLALDRERDARDALARVGR